MKVTFNQFSRLEDRYAQLNGVLLYGSDEGLIHQYATLIVKEMCGSGDNLFQLSTLSREQHVRLSEESAARSLIGGRRVVRVADAGDALLAQLRRLAALPKAAFIILEGPNLAGRSKLKGFAELASNWAAIPCYPTSGVALQEEVKRAMRADKINISDEVIQQILLRLSDDCLLRRADLETLVLYAGVECALTIAAIRDCFSLSLDSTLDDAFQAATMGDAWATDKAIANLLINSISGPSILAGFTYYLIRVARARQLVEDGMTIDATMRALSPPIFFQRQAAFAEGLRLWTTADLLSVLRQVRGADVACKKGGSADVTIAVQTLTCFAQEAERRRTRSTIGLRSAKQHEHVI